MDFSSLHKLIRLLKKEGELNKNLQISDVVKFSGNSNKVLQIEMECGRRMIVKQSNFEWARPRFYSARNASSLLQKQGSVISPDHIQIPSEVFKKPTLAYWYLSFPTLKELWPDLSYKQRESAIKSFGRLLRQIHEIQLDTYGLVNGENSFRSLSSFIENDLQNRLKPTLYAIWPEVIPIVEQLSYIIGQTPDKERKAVLVHNDLHIGNVLCNTDGKEIECAGFFDLEEAKGGCWESDIASAIILHHPLFAGTENNVEWLTGFGDFLLDGYKRKPDPLLLHFFQIYHLLNLGLFSVMNGDNSHAYLVLEEIKTLRDVIFQDGNVIIPGNIHAVVSCADKQNKGKRR